MRVEYRKNVKIYKKPIDKRPKGKYNKHVRKKQTGKFEVNKMTFKKFSAIVGEYRPNAVVHPHGTFGGVPDVAIYFVNPDGKQSKVYSYRGTYAEILRKLGIEIVTESDILTVKYNLERAKRNHGKISLFTKKKIDNSEKIEKYTELLNQMEKRKI